MKLTDKQKNVIDIVQWVCIILLLAVSLFLYFNRNNRKFITDTEYQKEQTYVKIYESQEIASLKKINQSLHDSIKNMKNVEYAVEVRYKYKYQTDTIKVTEFVEREDSVYHYHSDNDTIVNDTYVKAKDLQWMQANITINDRFTIINREQDDMNQTFVTHSPLVEIDNVDVWHRKENAKWYERFVIGPQVGVGYGLYNRKLDFYVGVGVSYSF